MMISRKFIADDHSERYLAESWDRMRQGYFRRDHHPRFLRRIWNRHLASFGPGEHATRVWTKWFGRVHISRSM